MHDKDMCTGLARQPGDNCAWRRASPVDAMGDEGVRVSALSLDDVCKVVPCCCLQQQTLVSVCSVWGCSKTSCPAVAAGKLLPKENQHVHKPLHMAIEKVHSSCITAQ